MDQLNLEKFETDFINLVLGLHTNIINDVKINIFKMYHQNFFKQTNMLISSISKKQNNFFIKTVNR